MPADDPLQRRPDLTLARERLGWEPEIELDDGLARTVAYFRGLDPRPSRRPTRHGAHASTDRDRAGRS